MQLAITQIKKTTEKDKNVQKFAQGLTTPHFNKRYNIII